MPAYFDRVAIVGAGLLGASLGLALKARGMAGRVAGVGRRESALDKALDMRAIDEAHLEIAPAAHGAQLVVLCTPAAQVVRHLDTVRELVSPETVVTDVASTKGALCAHARDTWPKPRRFVGSHPMAGSEKFGPEFGRADFYAGTVCLVEQADDLDPAARDAVTALWEGVGARVTGVDALEHDALLARTSHLPHVAASAVALLAGRQGNVREVIGNGFRDSTRIAAGRPELWCEICLTNRDAILDGLGELAGALEEFRAALERGDEAALSRFFEEGRAARERAVGA
jgi:prephenate dehydrogenase